MYLNGTSLLDKRKSMKNNFLPMEGKFQCTIMLDVLLGVLFVSDLVFH